MNTIEERVREEIRRKLRCRVADLRSNLSSMVREALRGEITLTQLDNIYAHFSTKEDSEEGKQLAKELIDAYVERAIDNLVGNCVTGVVRNRDSSIGDNYVE